MKMHHEIQILYEKVIKYSNNLKVLPEPQTRNLSLKSPRS